ncbi:MAG: rod shape-determining protein MreC [Ruminococcus sp.]|nr:rod shape-determining protein MreC [Ruminococcus sp.]HAE51963.1 rod shape-determining protein MreC [Ruminococcus sp.]
MKSFVKSTRFRVLIVFIAFLVGIMIYGVTKGGYSLSAASLINMITQPLKSVSNSIGMEFERISDKIFSPDKYYEENQQLKERINELNRKLAEYDDLKAEVEELRKFADMKEEYPELDMSMPAEVLGYITNDPFRSFTVDKGKADGIEPFSPVITSDGLVGMTVEVSEKSSTIRTILSPDLSVAAIASSTNADYGVIEGTVLTAADGHTKMSHLSTAHKLKEGDLIVTAGNTGMFPKDYPIGTVISTDFEINGLSACAEIEPCCDVTRLSTVFIITDFTGKKEGADEAQTAP